MKKIKKLEDLKLYELSRAHQKLFYGAYGEKCYDEETGIQYTIGWINGREVCVDDRDYGGGGSGAGSGGAGSGGGTYKPQCHSCSGFCMPGDNVDNAIWWSTKLGNQIS